MMEVLFLLMHKKKYWIKHEKYYALGCIYQQLLHNRISFTQREQQHVGTQLIASGEV